MSNSSKYNLEERTFDFSNRVRILIQLLPKNQINYYYSGQVIRSSSSVGANYREANETVTKKDFKFRIRISKKEAKESSYWLNLLLEANPDYKHRIKPLFQESLELMRILAVILRNYK
jgi:four helix bundle protein